MSDERDEPAAEIGDVGIRLNEADGIGIHISGGPVGLPDIIRPISRVIAVNGRPIKGLSIGEVRQLLPGPVGSEVCLEFLTMEGVRVNVTLRRTAIVKAKALSDSARVMKEASELLDSYDFSVLPAVYLNACHSCEHAGLGIFSSALANLAVTLSEQWFEQQSTTALITCVRAAPYLDNVGRVGEADDLIERALLALDQLEITNFGPRDLLMFVDHLRATGRLSTAEKAYQKLKSCAELGGNPSRIAEVLRAYASFLLDQTRMEEAEMTLDRLVIISKETKSTGDLLFAADSFASKGFNEKATLAYREFIELSEAIRGDAQRTFDKEQPILSALYKIAVSQDASGAKNAALATLKEAYAMYVERLSPTQQVELEQLPLFFPAMSDVEILLAKLIHEFGDHERSAAYLQMAIERIERALGPDSPYLKKPLLDLAAIKKEAGEQALSVQLSQRCSGMRSFPEKQPAISPSSHLDISLAFEVVSGGDDSTADDVIDRLLSAYRHSVDKEKREKTNRRIWNCLIHFGRMYAKHGRYVRAKHLFDRLVATGARPDQPATFMIPLLLEEAILAEHLRSDSEEIWKELERLLAFDSQKEDQAKRPAAAEQEPFSGIPEVDGLRRLAVAYLHSGEVDHARRILSRAQTLVASASGSVGLGMTALLECDNALCAAHCSDLAAARSAISKSLSMTPHIETKRARKLVQLANFYVRLDAQEDAEELLSSVIERTSYRPEWLERAGVPVPALFQWQLAKVLIKRRKNSEAYDLVERAMQQYKSKNNAVPPTFCNLAGDAAAAIGMFDEAARYYFSACSGLTSFHVVGLHQTYAELHDIRKQLLRKALQCADKAQKLSSEELIAILKATAACMQSTDKQEAERLYERALKLAPEKSKESAEIALHLSRLCESGGNDKEQQLQAEERAAILAESADKSASYSAWLLVARTELDLKKTDKAIEHTEHAIHLFAQHGKRKTHFQPLLRNNRDSIAHALRALGKSEDAERLLLQAIATVKSVYGSVSHEECISLVELVDHHMILRQYDQMTAVIEQTLAQYSLLEARLPLDGSHVHAAIRWLFLISKRLCEAGCKDKSLDIGMKILALQRQKLPSNNIQIAETLFALAGLHEQMDDLERAVSALKEGIEIVKQHGRLNRLTLPHVWKCAAILRKLGKAEEASRLMTLTPESTTSRSERLDMQRLHLEARRQEGVNNFDRAAELYEARYAAAVAEAAYSPSTLEALEALAQFYFRRRNYAESAQLYEQLVSAFDVTQFSSQPNRKRCVLELAKIYVLTEQDDKAKSMILKAKVFDAELYFGNQTVHSALAYADLESEVSLYSEAEEDLECAERLLLEHAAEPDRALSRYALLGQIAEIWRRLGRDDRASRIQEVSANLEKNSAMQAPQAGLADVSPSEAAPGATESSISAKNESPEDRHARMRREMDARREQRRRDREMRRREHEARAEQNRLEQERILMERERKAKDEEEQNAVKLKEALARCEALQESGKRTSPDYHNALFDLMLCYRSGGEQSKFEELFDQAIELLSSREIQDSTQDALFRQLCQYLRFVSRVQYESKFLQIFRLIESGHRSDRLHSEDRFISESVRHLEEAKLETRELWCKLIEIRSSIKGENHRSLEPLIMGYAAACEREHRLDDSEKAYKRIVSLNENWTVDAICSAQLRLAMFYLRRGMFDKAEVTWRPVEEVCRGGATKSTANNFADLLQQYMQWGRTSDVEALLDILLDGGGDNIILALDKHLELVIDRYISSGSLAKAEALLSKRVKAADRCLEDLKANWWRLKLSEMYMAAGQDSESVPLFDQVKAATVLGGGSAKHLLQQRALFLERLGKTEQAEEIKRQIGAPIESGPLILRFGMFAAQEIQFGHNTSIDEYDSSKPLARVDPRYLQSTICCLGLVDRKGNFSFSGTIYTARPDPAQLAGGHRARHFAGALDPVPDDVQLPMPALKPPGNAINLRSDRAVQPLQPGDYRASDLPARAGFGSGIPGRIRVFLSDDGPVPSAIDSNHHPFSQHRPVDYQIWYNGSRIMRLKDMSGVVYAPKATIVIPFNGNFRGAIVANRIIGEGNNRFTFDLSLLNEVFE